VRILHHRIAALVSAVLVAFGSGVARGENAMKKSLKSSQPDVPVYTSRRGSRYVRSVDIIRSKAGRKELSLQLQNKPKDNRRYAVKVSRVSKTKA
jgi:hypothetical protein